METTGRGHRAAHTADCSRWEARLARWLAPAAEALEQMQSLAVTHGSTQRPTLQRLRGRTDAPASCAMPLETLLGSSILPGDDRAADSGSGGQATFVSAISNCSLRSGLSVSLGSGSRVRLSWFM